MRNIILASHHKLAAGMASSLEFLSGYSEAYVIAAYVDETDDDLSRRIDLLMHSLDQNEETFIFTDLLGGSVAQKFYPYIGEHVHLICGMNLPLVLEVALGGPEPYDAEKIAQLVDSAREAIVYVNSCNTLGSDDE